MTQNKTKAKNMSTGKKVAVTTGLVAVVAGVAGAYYLYGTKDGTKKRKLIRGWSLKAKGEVIEKLEKLKEVNEEVYNKVVDEVMRRYKAVKNIDPKEITSIVSELKGHWKNIKKHLNTGGAKK